MNAENNGPAAKRSRSRLQRVVRWMAKEIDDMPDILKALIWTALIINGSAGIVAVVSMLISAAISVALK